MLARQRQRRAQEGSPQTIQVFLRTRIKLAYIHYLSLVFQSYLVSRYLDPLKAEPQEMFMGI